MSQERIDQQILGQVAWWKKMGFDISGGIVVDAGAGRIDKAKALARHAAIVRTIDDNASVDEVQTHGLNVEKYRGLIPGRHNCPYGEADFLLCTNVLEHLEPTDVPQFLSDCYKLLRPGGAGFFSWAPVWSRLGAHVGSRPATWEHISHSKDEWYQFMNKRYGKDFADMWMQHEWRPGLSRKEWYGTEVHLTIAQLVRAISNVGFSIIHHNMRQGDESAFVNHPRSSTFDKIIKEGYASFYDFTCVSDSWLIKRPG